MTSKEALEQICGHCERAGAKIKTLCPYRSISGDYCEAYEYIKTELKAFEIIKEHPLLDLGNLAEYDDNLFEDYWENEHGTTNELTEEEFKTLKEVIKI